MTRNEILDKVLAGKIGVDEASAMLAALTPTGGELYCKVSPKGAISVYGLQQMPVTLYVKQWQRLAAFMDELEAFAREWDGKDYHSEHATERGGKKVPYTARIAHKAAAPYACSTSGWRPRPASASPGRGSAYSRLAGWLRASRERICSRPRVLSLLRRISAPLLAVLRLRGSQPTASFPPAMPQGWLWVPNEQGDAK